MFFKGGGWEGGKKETHAKGCRDVRNENRKLSFFKREYYKKLACSEGI